MGHTVVAALGSQMLLQSPDVIPVKGEKRRLLVSQYVSQDSSQSSIQETAYRVVDKRRQVMVQDRKVVKRRLGPVHLGVQALRLHEALHRVGVLDPHLTGEGAPELRSELFHFHLTALPVLPLSSP